MSVFYTKSALQKITKEDLIHIHLGTQDHIKKLEEENEKLKDFTHWENHPALKHKVVLDDDYYLEHVEDGELIDPETFSLLKDEKEHLDSLVDELHNDINKLKTQMDALRKQTCCADGEKLEDRIGEIIHIKKNYLENVERLMKEKKELKEENDTQKLMVDGLVKTIQELKEDAEKIEKLLRDKAPAWVVDMCLPIWYGDEEEEN
jgi:prefoldin subunit 5